MTAPVFVDVDTGVDDALALIYLLASPDADVVGIASTGGNVAVERVCRTISDCSSCAGAPTYRSLRAPTRHWPARSLLPQQCTKPGAWGTPTYRRPLGRLTDYDSATAWVRTARDFPGELIGVATAPLTNLALALRAEPALPTLLHRLVIMGGAYDLPRQHHGGHGMEHRR